MRNDFVVMGQIQRKKKIHSDNLEKLRSEMGKIP